MRTLQKTFLPSMLLVLHKFFPDLILLQIYVGLLQKNEVLDHDISYSFIDSLANLATSLPEHETKKKIFIWSAIRAVVKIMFTQCEERDCNLMSDESLYLDELDDLTTGSLEQIQVDTLREYRNGMISYPESEVFVRINSISMEL